jgi:predicted DNA-binding protein with PD1-like motif
VRWKLIGLADAPTYVVVLDPGDEAMAVLSGFAAAQHLTGAQVTAVGAFERAVIGWFDREAKHYRPIRVDQQCEVLSLVGDVALGTDGPQPHIHAVLGLPDGSTRGGHLLEGRVWPTLEVIIRETHAGLRKSSRPEIGLALIDLDE